MQAIFFNLPVEFDQAINQVYPALGVRHYLVGDSQNVLGGTYGTVSLLGLKIKLELNSYDYEDEYKYMISVSHDVLSDVSVSSKGEHFAAELICDLLYNNLKVKIAIEHDDGLQIYSV